MPKVPITDIKRHQKDLVVSTQGRSMWILDDVTPLSQVTPQTATSAAALFKPGDAIRGRLGGGRGGFGSGRGAAPAISGQAQFAENGAPITYYLGRAPAGPITIDIVDATGKTVRSYSSAGPTAAAAEDAPAPNAAEEGGPGF